ncbi:DUF924-domain-containing protein [Auricularia subglabra TFB-10046 SS5]|uniref:DUF924-domain-containing protein n=1 Tax=Auricularia subglabra (strain TFB-10046 / SS5) TaxID=717982 RepID=J0DC48_AURST|nr:DUF924-domain-containing protein [Auricularia subglabra TFB-10046 SS5]
MSTAADDVNKVLDFWFGHQKDHYTLNSKLWFFAAPAKDAEVKEVFEPIHERLARDANARKEWLAQPKGAIALVILFDQMPRNMFRGTPESFATDALALPVALQIASQPDQRALWPNERLFAYMCMVHAEDLELARRSEKLVHTLALDYAHTKTTYKGHLRSWREHIEALERFGRYPHRNGLLGRESTPDELAYLELAKSRWVRSVIASKPSTPAVGKTSTPAQKPMRILVLHGFRQNAHIMRRAIKKLAASLRAHGHSLHFIESPQTYKVGFSPDGKTDVVHDTWNDAGTHQKAWWNANDDGSVYAGADKTLKFIEEVWRKEGGFDGVLGFSQGATLIGILASLPKPNPISFRFAVNISGYPSRASAHKEWQSTKIDGIASLNLYGVRDEHLGTPEQMKAKTYALAALFNDAKIVEHAGGHFTPSYWPFEEIERFILAQGTSIAPLTDPGELEGVAAKMEASLLAESRYPGAPFVPLGLSPAVRQAILDAGLPHLLDGERTSPLKAEDFVRLLQTAPRHLDDLLVVAHAFRSKRASEHEGDTVFAACWLALYELDPTYMLRQLPLVPKFCEWVDLQAVAVANHERHPWTLPQRGVTPGAVNALHAAVVTLFADQLARDRDILLEQDAEGGEDAVDLSAAAHGAPRTRSRPDTVCRLAREIALTLRPVPGADALSQQEYDRAKLTSYIGYAKLCGVLRQVWARSHSTTHAVTDTEKAMGVLSDADRAAILAAPPNEFVVHPTEVPVVPCSAQDLAPLLRGLRENATPLQEHVKFARGTIIRERKVLDLCKQVVGPDGVGPLLDAMKGYESITGLLLGNNITGSKGAQEIAAYIRDPTSRITTWYIAGNQFNAADISLVCDALSKDRKVKALWLKRNPLLPAGTLHVASMLRVNTTLQTLDLANCGLLDDGAAHLFAALAHNRTLKHLYLNANGLTPRSAALIGDHLARGSVLEALHLNCNPFGDAGVRELARGLALDTSLLRLALGSVSMGSAGADALIDALVPGAQRQAAHPRLSYLSIGFMKGTYVFNGVGNCIRDAGAAAVAARLLPALPTLRGLDLCHNQIGPAGLAAIVRALDDRRNTTLCDLLSQQFGQPGSFAIDARLKALLHENLVRWGREHLHGEGDVVAWEAAGSKLLRAVECPDYVEDILSVYRTKE